MKSTRSGTSSRTALFLGRESGKMRLLAKGAMKRDSPFRGLLEPGNVLEALYYFKAGRDLFYVKELTSLGPPAMVRISLEEIGARLAALELVDGATIPGNPERGVYDLLKEFLACDIMPGPLEAFLAFELRLLERLGLGPSFDRCARCHAPIEQGVFDPACAESYCKEDGPSCGDAVSLEKDLMESLALAARLSFDGFARHGMSSSTRKKFGSLMHRIYTYHVQGYEMPRSFKLLKAPF